MFPFSDIGENAQKPWSSTLMTIFSRVAATTSCVGSTSLDRNHLGFASLFNLTSINFPSFATLPFRSVPVIFTRSPILTSSKRLDFTKVLSNAPWISLNPTEFSKGVLNALSISCSLFMSAPSAAVAAEVPGSSSIKPLFAFSKPGGGAATTPACGAVATCGGTCSSAVKMLTTLFGNHPTLPPSRVTSKPSCTFGFTTLPNFSPPPISTFTGESAWKPSTSTSYIENHLEGWPANATLTTCTF
mmetsp:Transcript_8463/g.24282  ORF Transcript_8463/g.24282 Transcript_8463/m.24282 type:complete len:244 (-) Transcript_8463:587-1318(-)